MNLRAHGVAGFEVKLKKDTDSFQSAELEGKESCEILQRDTIKNMAVGDFTCFSS